MTGKIQIRDIRETAFCWQEKDALKTLNTHFDNSDFPTKLPYARSLYLALTEIASDNQQETFPASLGYIATRAGFSVSEVKRLLPELEKIGIISVKRRTSNGVNLPNEITLNGRFYQSQVGSGRKKAVRATLEESYKESKKKREGKFTPPTISEIQNFITEYAAEKNLFLSNPEIESEKIYNFYESKDWHIGKSKMKDWKSACRNWLLRDQNQTMNMQNKILSLTGKAEQKQNIDERWLQ
jgi:DNA-binding Lrp family transcriptional regulator